ncbi:IS481 family transposase [Aestuariivirga litoralis]|uniref:IS481 family transposase n=1 Tax=Aestuariivirga litoralis TaxID=2650924 RepID=A0A2W2BRU5_9HYPH|nr:IS481 family transposase [Aestuariivirga litoralis]PZF76146.1 IS481 family transposase [Aestuariivirga litoralis]
MVADGPSAGDVGGFADRSRRPPASPRRTADGIEQRILAARAEHPAWGARKIRAVLERAGQARPACSTVHQVLKRHGLILPEPGGEPARLRFEAAAPNDLWQMDFKGHSRLGDGSRLHPLTVVDDHSRYAPCLKALGGETGEEVKAALTQVFAVHGLPPRIFTDNGTPWGGSQGNCWTRFRVWLLKLGVDLIHSRPYHPQSRGKNERFHRSMDEEVLSLRPLATRADAQKAFDHWRLVYNHQRPHEALGLAVPASRYRPSIRPMPSKPAQPHYEDGTLTRKVPATKSDISFQGRHWKVPEAFCGERLAIRPLAQDGQFGVFFASHQIASIDLTDQ